MPKGYFIRCSDCGYLYECEEDLMECLNKHICEHCGSSNMEVIQQQEGRFGCTSRMNTHVVNADLHPDFP
ncbi:hypothetical protein [Sporomusa sphaeroides]|uniref:C2H2-type domain-containing protein n=1 Tax=Sporomusa sphaeroides DSM 2875 TaxID=1337886 RepID=A0ABM9W349_9FIRM|nr:hypothetical protein [Sporomusa sphaeroides]OLS55087.1 hypothetical protein SPSPH_38240 [Sporomusa sphaeroides DSM 2875]CVK19533.1 hypothetical protein SSPH_02184 [Sporomusa sphaeroides DSM 2875]